MPSVRLGGSAEASNRAADRRVTPVVKKGLIVIVVFYLLGVFGVAAGQLSSTWDSEWSFGQQLAEAIQTGLSWPKLAIDLIIGE